MPDRNIGAVVTRLPSGSHGLPRLQPKYPCNALFKVKDWTEDEKGGKMTRDLYLAQ